MSPQAYAESVLEEHGASVRLAASRAGHDELVMVTDDERGTIVVVIMPRRAAWAAARATGAAIAKMFSALAKPSEPGTVHLAVLLDKAACIGTLQPLRAGGES